MTNRNSRALALTAPTPALNRRRASGADQLRPDQVPVLGPEVPPAQLASGLALDADAFGRREAGSLGCEGLIEGCWVDTYQVGQPAAVVWSEEL